MTARRHLHLHVLATAAVCAAVACGILLVGGGRHTTTQITLPSWPQSDLLVRTPHAAMTQTASITVRFRSGLSNAKQKQLLAGYSAVTTGSLPLGLTVVSVAPSKAKHLLSHLRASHDVATATPDQVRSIAGDATSSALTRQWALQRIGWRSDYRSATNKRNVNVAILDTGVDTSLSDLGSRVVGGYSAFAGAKPTSDPNGHGTWMTSIALAVDPHATVMPVQVLDAQGLGKDSDIIKGLVWAADHHANVILMSFAGTGYSPALQRAIDYAWSKGAVVVAATGNSGSSAPTYPAGDAKVVGVSATNALDRLWSGSNYGLDTFLAAPGVDIVADSHGGGTTSVTGTSASAALVAGGAALLLGADPKATNSIAVGRLASSAHKAGTRAQTGNGRLDIARALSVKNAKGLVPAGVAGRQVGGPFVGPYTIAGTATGPTVVGSGVCANAGGVCTASSNTLVLTLTAAVPQNTTLFVVVGRNAISGATLTGTDNATGGPNTWVNDEQLSTATAPAKTVAILRATVTHAFVVGNTITITFPTANTSLKSATAFYFNGVVTGTPLDQIGTGTNTTTPATAATTATTTQATELVIGGVANATPGAANNSCTASTIAGVAGTMQVEPLYKNVTTTGVQTCGSAVANSTWAAAVATYKVDMTNPTAAVTYPTANQSAASWTGTITGSATDEANGSGIDVTAGKTQLSIHDDTANQYWNGAWGAVGGGETYFNPTTGPTTVTPGSAATWTYTFAGANMVVGHSYTIHTTTTDYAGNASSVATQTFTYVGGASTPTVAGAGNSAVSGTTLAVTTNLSAVPLNSTIFIVFGLNASSVFNMTATDSGGNVYTRDAMINNATAPAKTVAIFRAPVTTALTTASTVTVTWTGVAAATLRSATVFYVKGLVSNPLDGAVGTATGSSAAAAATTVGATTNGNDFIVGGVANATPAAGSNSCTALTAAGTAGTMQEEPVYKTVQTNATQTCGATVANAPWAAATASYKIDSTAPTAAVPMASAYNAAGWSGVFGTATDEAGGSGIDVTAGVTQLSLHDDTSNQYWTGAAWGAVAGAETYVNPTTGPSAATAGSPATWSYTTVTSANLTNGHNYTVHTKTADYAGNASAVGAKTFNYDTTAPTASFTIVPGTNPLYQFYNSGSHTLYYNPTVAGDFKIDGSASSDAGSGLAGTVFPGIGTAANTAMTQSPVLFWRFSETAGTSVADSSGYGNTGVTSGGVTRNTTPTAFTTDTDPGITFTAASFGKVVGAYPRALPSGSASRSEVVWFKTTTTTEQALATYGCTDGVTGCAAGQNFGLMVIPSANNLMFWGWGDDLTFSTSAVVANTADGNWHQAVITYTSGGAITMYLDGTSLGSQTPTTGLNTMAAGAQGFNVGVGVPTNDASNGGKYFNGSIDDVSVYSSVLSAAQVTAQYTARTLPVGFTGIGSVSSGSPWQSLTNAWTTSATTAPGAETLLAADAAGNTSSVNLNYVVDSTLPTGSLTAPAASTNVRGSAVAVSSNSADAGSGVASAQFQYSPAGAGIWTNIGAADTTNPYSVNWDTTLVSDGLYDLRVVTTDNVNNSFTSALVTNVRVDNTAPTNALSLSSITGGAYLNGTTVYYRGSALGNFQLTNTV
ncbi:MAG: S8 family serine peptidase, partial [Acidimicrobiia bacterium]